ncbi:hypothetical protein SLEP1_g48404 [Rubroshorea leprosula]|uniref:Uncharacterized protein n=1 Tax=Rubroshorea leprosula TaxID=152421 RepID=A0AAV5LVL7_9ROSI|nr:hypothetical protein SLEP1_g48404 [Rubroshorea leprosula]
MVDFLENNPVRIGYGFGQFLEVGVTVSVVVTVHVMVTVYGLLFTH